MKNILFLRGINDKSEVKISKIHKNSTLDYVITGSTNLISHLKNRHFNIIDIVLDASNTQELSIGKIDAVFNQISDADTHRVTLSKVEDLYRHYRQKVPMFNAPNNIIKTTRDNIYILLEDIENLYVPKTIKIQPRTPDDIYSYIDDNHFVFPVIFRKAGDHGGVSTIRVEDRTENFYTFPLDGRDYYLTQFMEYVDDDGIYCKYRLIVVAGEVFLRHVIIGRSWMIHAESQLNDEHSLSYKTSVSHRFDKEIKPAIQHTVTKIYNHLGLDYFGIDCYIDSEMKLLIFEINANMNIFKIKENSIFKQHTEKAKDALINLLIAESD